MAPKSKPNAGVVAELVPAIPGFAVRSKTIVVAGTSPATTGCEVVQI
jgi:hypothetical protein